MYDLLYILFYLVINAPGKFTIDLLLKCVDFKSEISLDNWNYLLEIASYLIELSPNLKGLICAFYGNNLIIYDLNLIVKFYNILGIGVQTSTPTTPTASQATTPTPTPTQTLKLTPTQTPTPTQTLKPTPTQTQTLKPTPTQTQTQTQTANTFNLLLRHVLIDKLNFFNFIQFLKSLNYSLNVLIEIFHEFLMSESKEKEIFIIKLTLCQICGTCDDGTGALYNFNTKTLNYCKSGNWDLLYKSLVINTLTKTFPTKLKQQFEILCEICNLDAKELKLEIEETVKEPTKYYFNAVEFGNRKCIYFMENFNILTSNITAFNCLTQLLKLLELNNFNEINYFINYIRKQKRETVSNDLYFNLLFIE